ncbi:hypothetical protein BC835DRAFT_1006954 [Cytidiella melzeri]|nr:hypothetical protein BC835DRAFT_1006954 [Cytidiella melzeri]
MEQHTTLSAQGRSTSTASDVDSDSRALAVNALLPPPMATPYVARPLPIPPSKLPHHLVHDHNTHADIFNSEPGLVRFDLVVAVSERREQEAAHGKMTQVDVCSNGEEDEDDDASHYSNDEEVHEPYPSSFSDPGHYAYSERPPQQADDKNGVASGSSAGLHNSPRPSLQSAYSQQSLAVELAEREYGAVSELAPQKSSLSAAQQLRPSPTTALDSPSSASDRGSRSPQRSARLAAAIGHRQAYAMSDPGHGPATAPRSRLPPRSTMPSTAGHRPYSTRQGRATWAHSEFPPLDVVLESGGRDEPVTFSSSSNHASTSTTPFHYAHSRCYGSLPNITQSPSKYPATSPPPQHMSTLSGSSSSSHYYSTSHVTFATSDLPRPRKVSNKLRKAPRCSGLATGSLPTILLPSDMPSYAHVNSLHGGLTSRPRQLPVSPLSRSPSPRQRQRKKSILTRVLSFRRRKRSTGSPERTNSYAVAAAPFRIASTNTHMPAVSMSEENEGASEEDGEVTQEGGEGWRGSWWSEDGHAHARAQPWNVPFPRSSPSASALGSDAAIYHHTPFSRLPSRHGSDPTHTALGDSDHRMNGVQLRRYQDISLLPSQPQPQPQPQARSRRVLVKRSRSRYSQPASSPPNDTRPDMLATMSSTSSVTQTTSSHASHASSLFWRSSTVSTPPTSPGTSEAHASGSSSSACPPARPQSYFAELQLPLPENGRVVLETSAFDTRHPRVVSESGRWSVGGSTTSTLCNGHGRKLSKRRSQAQPTVGVRGHQLSASVSTIGLVSAATESSHGIKVQTNHRGRAAARDEGTESVKGRSKSRSRSRSIMRVTMRSSPNVEKDKEAARVAGTRADYLPQLRPLEPLWVGNGMLQSPYARHSYPSSLTNTNSAWSLPSPKGSTTDALTSLAFTGHAGLLSSSALAALTSRLAHSGQVTEDQARSPSPSPFIHSSKENAGVTFDPYAEQKENKKNDKRDSKSTFGSKTKQVAYKTSFSFLRFDSTPTPAVGRKASPVPPVPPLPTRFEHERKQYKATTPPKPVARVKEKTVENSPSTLRRWTLAMADVSDEVLVQELEKIRKEVRASRNRRRRPNMKSPPASSVGHGHATFGPEESKWREEWNELRDAHRRREGDGEGNSDSESDTSRTESGDFDDSSTALNIDDAGWKTARRALLCCRELVRTERSYQTRLRQLLSGETNTPPPVLVLSYVPALLRASEALLARLEDDPSAWGVSAAFVGVEEEVEAAFVAWCGIVGELFEGGDAPADREGRKLTRSPAKTSSSQCGHGQPGKRTASVSLDQSPPDSHIPRRASSFLDDDRIESNTGLGMFTAALGTGLAYNIAPPTISPPAIDEFRSKGITTYSKARSVAGVHANVTGSGPLSISKALRRMSVFSSASSLPTSTPVSPSSAHSTYSASTGKNAKKEKKPTVRELAIHPTQRVMRYVLQYRDLLSNTPVESPSRGLVERALESALRIAAKCDRAQGNSAFFRHA